MHGAPTATRQLPRDSKRAMIERLPVGALPSIGDDNHPMQANQVITSARARSRALSGRYQPADPRRDRVAVATLCSQSSKVPEHGIRMLKSNFSLSPAVRCKSIRAITQSGARSRLTRRPAAKSEVSSGSATNWRQQPDQLDAVEPRLARPAFYGAGSAGVSAV